MDTDISLGVDFQDTIDAAKAIATARGITEEQALEEAIVFTTQVLGAEFRKRFNEWYEITKKKTEPQ